MIISQFPSGSAESLVPQFTYTGDYEIRSDAGGWKIRFLSSGTLTFFSSVIVDIFAVGGGGNGLMFCDNTLYDGNGNKYVQQRCGGGGGSGYTKTVTEYTLAANTAYTVSVGLAGMESYLKVGNTNICTANGGANCLSMDGADGGTGGAAGAVCDIYENGNYRGGNKSLSSAQNGQDGKDNRYQYVFIGGDGQGTTTREFGEASGKLYANGGGSYSTYVTPPQILPNTGDGGHGGQRSNNGASGIVIIRNTRA